MTTGSPASNRKCMIPLLPLQTPSLPPGAVIAFAGDIGAPVSTPSSPDDYTTDPVPNGAITNNIEAWGWMVCDGRMLYCRAYPQLFLAIGFLYSQQSDPYQPGFNGTLPADAEFRIPDYRGYFLRGVSGTAGAGVDPDVANRQLVNTQLNQGVGTIQQDALQNHWHGYAMAQGAPIQVQEGGAPALESAGTSDTQPPTTIPNPPGTAKETIRTSTETRAKNFYVHYLIKYV